jgi:hypothetical protein
VRIKHLEAQVSEHPEGLRTGDLMDEVGADEELGGSIGKGANGVRLPHLVE